MWSYAASGFFRKFAVTAFFSIYEVYIQLVTDLRIEKVTQGSTILGCTSVVGVVLIIVTHDIEYSRLLAHASSCISFGVITFAMTGIESQVSRTSE